MKDKKMNLINETGNLPSDQFRQTAYDRRTFLKSMGIAIPAISLLGCSTTRKATNALQSMPGNVPGFEKEVATAATHAGWVPVSDRKIKFGIIGFGASQFGSAFGFQNHPNVEIVAVSDLIPERREALAKACRCSKTYDSLELLLEDDEIEAVWIATDAPSHKDHTIKALNKGKHVAVAVPAVFGSVDDAFELFEAVKKSDRLYMMFETSMFHDDLWAMRQIFKAGGFGDIIYSENSYYHYTGQQLTPSYKEWRKGLPPIWYPTHATAYYVGVTDGYFTEVSCRGVKSIIEHSMPKNNRYKNPFRTHVAQMATNSGGVNNTVISWDSYGFGREGGTVRGQIGSYQGSYQGTMKDLPDLTRPSLPEGMEAGGHGGSHGRLTDEFVRSILENRKPLIDVAMALNMTVPGIVAHQSAMKNGKTLDIPHFSMR